MELLTHGHGDEEVDGEVQPGVETVIHGSPQRPRRGGPWRRRRGVMAARGSGTGVMTARGSGAGVMTAGSGGSGSPRRGGSGPLGDEDGVEEVLLPLLGRRKIRGAGSFS